LAGNFFFARYFSFGLWLDLGVYDGEIEAGYTAGERRLGFARLHSRI